MEHQFYGPRLVSCVIDALRQAGVTDPAQHLAVYDLPKMRRNLLLIAKQPLTEEIRQNAFVALTPELFEDIHLLYPPPEKLKDNVVARIVRDGWKGTAETAKINLAPATDDRPFIGQMGLWRNLSRDGLRRLSIVEVSGFPLAKAMIAAIIGVVALVLVPLNLLPYLRRGPRMRVVPWLYFFTIGAAFMIVEVVLIQKYRLFIGPSVYSIAAILLALLLASGLGSRLAPLLADWVPFAGIAAWLVLDVIAGHYWIYGLSSLGMGLRIVLTVLWVVPLGVFMGMPFPKAALRVGELVDWGFAVNGAASVLGAAGVLLVAFELGVSVAMLLGACLYLVAFALLAAQGRWQRMGADRSTGDGAAQPVDGGVCA